MECKADGCRQSSAENSKVVFAVWPGGPSRRRSRLLGAVKGLFFDVKGPGYGSTLTITTLDKLSSFNNIMNIVVFFHSNSGALCICVRLVG